ncbi:MAG: transglutaminase-like cysteine peptidase [Thermotogota bacterium]|nr:transglutaminase-like cysteine peptidase [Thermotogota bacterium]
MIKMLGIILLCSSCLGYIVEPNAGFNPIYHEGVKFKSIEQINIFVNFYIRYKKDDEKNTWQYPQDTYLLRTGDCEDFAILKMVMANYYLNIIGEIYHIKNKDNTYHAVFVYNSMFYDFEAKPYSQYEYLKDKEIYTIYSFEDALSKCKK